MIIKVYSICRKERLGKSQSFSYIPCYDAKGGGFLSEKKKGNTAAIVYDLAKPITDALGLVLWDVVFEKEGASWYLRIVIDRDGDDFVSTEDCSAVSRQLDPLLDEADPIEQSYYLEVMSPGLGRKLKRPEHFAPFIGAEVTVRLIRPVDGIRDFVGTLTAFADRTVFLQTASGPKQFSFTDCSFVKVNDDLNL